MDAEDDREDRQLGPSKVSTRTAIGVGGDGCASATAASPGGPTDQDVDATLPSDAPKALRPATLPRTRVADAADEDEDVDACLEAILRGRDEAAGGNERKAVESSAKEANRRQRPSATAGGVSSSRSATKASAVNPVVHSFGPYSMMDDGLYVSKQKPGKNPFTELVSNPLEVMGYCRDVRSRRWGKTTRFSDADGNVHICHVSEAALHGDPRVLAGKLGDEGLHVRRRYQADFADYLNAIQPLGRVTLVKRTGWHTIDGKLVFVLPAETIGALGLKEIILLEGATIWV